MSMRTAQRNGHLKLIGALNNDIRLTIMEILTEQTDELTMTQIRHEAEACLQGEVSPPSIAQHLDILVEASLIKTRKQGRHRYYACQEPEFFEFVIELCNTVTMRPEKLLQWAMSEV